MSVKQKINIGTDVWLDDFMTTRALFQATSGGGKSYLLRKFAEMIATTGMHQIIIDPEGEFATLREKYNFALWSKNGDIPLSLRYAEAVAQKIMETNLSVIIDIYELNPADRVKFVNVFLTALINIDKKLYHPCIVYLDEADKFAPQKEKIESSQAVINLCAMGRKRGYCAVLATQRVSKLSKDATAELLNKFVGMTGQDLDRKRAGEELGLGNKVDILALKKLKPGQFYASGPAVGYSEEPFQVSKVFTTHPESGARITAAPPTPNAIRKILKGLADIPEEAERDLETKAQLQKEVNRLNQEIKQLRKGAPAAPSKKDPGLEQQMVLLKSQVKQDQVEINGLKKDRQRAIEALSKVVSLAKPFLGDSSVATPISAPTPSPRRDVPLQTERRGNGAISKHSLQGQPTDGEILGAGPLKMLKVLAMLSGDVISKERLSILSGYSIKSSTFGIYTRELRDKGIAEIKANGITITESGMAQVGAFEKLPTDPQSLISFWSQKLEQGPRKMFEILADNYPEPMSHQQLSDESGYRTTSSTFGIYVRKLKTLCLVVEKNKMLAVADHIYE